MDAAGECLFYDEYVRKQGATRREAKSISYVYVD